jgi:hypothetical protein
MHGDRRRGWGGGHGPSHRLGMGASLQGVHECMYVYVCQHVCARRCTSVYVCLCVCVSVHIHVYTLRTMMAMGHYADTHTHIHIHTHITPHHTHTCPR